MTIESLSDNENFENQLRFLINQRHISLDESL